MALNGFRKKRRPGNRAMTKAESARVTEAKFGRCMPCLSWALQGNMPIEHVAQGGDWDHKKRAGLRVGHSSAFLSCKWHHQAHPGDGWTPRTMRALYGPSLMDGSKPFGEAYGSDAYLIELQASETPL